MRDLLLDKHEQLACVLGLLRYLACPDPDLAEEADLVAQYGSMDEYRRYEALSRSSRAFSGGSSGDLEAFLKCRRVNER